MYQLEVFVSRLVSFCSIVVVVAVVVVDDVATVVAVDDVFVVAVVDDVVVVAVVDDVFVVLLLAEKLLSPEFFPTVWKSFFNFFTLSH